MSFANAEETNASVKEPSVQSGPTKPVEKQNVASPALLNKSKSEDVKKTLGGSEGERMKRKRKSRWGRELTEDERAVAVASATFSAATTTTTPYNKPQLTAEQQQQLREQQAMAAIVTQIRSGQQQQNKHNKYEYDSDEDTEGGTWEHKLRSAEMGATKVLADKLTEENKGKHHISDFLPPEELEKFMERVKAARGESVADLSDYAKHKIDESNIGYQMLKNAGWTEGQGLGSNEDGITAPVDKGKVSFDQTGVGIAPTGDVSSSDDDFDAYRKRMMLAYRFRPNPLNNPRRPYY
ncbi:SURP and G-patch domain-containing protein 1-like isoform X2 [Dysidea avara]|uniref:SURP and G-patch domain-containing protein 1-like isoform X2 n=1 Tax=Dysidea avara TaxID=196820 RepID=UPI00332DB39A